MKAIKTNSSAWETHGLWLPIAAGNGAVMRLNAGIMILKTAKRYGVQHEAASGKCVHYIQLKWRRPVDMARWDFPTSSLRHSTPREMLA